MRVDEPIFLTNSRGDGRGGCTVCRKPQFETFNLRDFMIWVELSPMSMKIKGIYKGIKCISQAFVVKEPEMDIGCPTDVKHVAHVGWDGSSDTGPTWMNNFGSLRSSDGTQDSSMGAHSPWPPEDSKQQKGSTGASDMTEGFPGAEQPNTAKKQKRKKIKSTSSKVT